MYLIKKVIMFLGCFVFICLIVFQVSVIEKFKVIIIFIIIVDMVKNVVGDVVEVLFIIKFGVEIYEYQFISGDIKCVQGV